MGPAQVETGVGDAAIASAASGRNGRALRAVFCVGGVVATAAGFNVINCGAGDDTLIKDVNDPAEGCEHISS